MGYAYLPEHKQSDFNLNIFRRSKCNGAVLASWAKELSAKAKAEKNEAKRADLLLLDQWIKATLQLEPERSPFSFTSQ